MTADRRDQETGGLKMIVNSTNKIISEGSAAAGAQDSRSKRHDAEAPSRGARTRRDVEILRGRILSVVCSGAWADDCLYRGAEYAPDFRCACARCRADFPDRLHPRQARQSALSGDCQVECEEDPELAEDLAKLRSDHVRVGSVFIVRGGKFEADA